jgi:hypothetical protein
MFVYDSFSAASAGSPFRKSQPSLNERRFDSWAEVGATISNSQNARKKIFVIRLILVEEE